MNNNNGAVVVTRSTESEAFRRRIESTLATVQAWDADPELLTHCRAQIPWDRLRNTNELDDDDDTILLLSPTHRFVQRLARYFQRHVMTWVHQPACVTCGGATILQGTRGPQTAAERDGAASRVEVYACSPATTTNHRNGLWTSSSTKQQHPETTFPRYNNVATLWQTRCGRCGEYANLFGLYCRAVGLETRYILDWTDHVWTEVYLPEDTAAAGSNSGGWMMVDSCEGVMDERSMYEAGWGKKLSYCVAIGKDHVVDVTPLYTRQWLTDDFQARRRQVISSESAGEAIIRQINEQLQSKLAVQDADKLRQRLAREQQLLQVERQSRIWEHQYGRGRISGSLAWKTARQEDGTTIDTSSQGEKKHPDMVASHFYVETYYPLSTDSRQDLFTIILQPEPATRHEAVVVNGVACAVGALNCLSVVVLDEQYLGCILQSRSFSNLSDLADFVTTIPAQRIVAIVGKLGEETANPDSTLSSTSAKLCELGSFDPRKVHAGVLFVGQVLAQPEWALCYSFDEAVHGIRVNGGVAATKCPRKLRTALGVQPASVIGRLPDSVMPLQTQQLAGHEQKRAAFLSFMSSKNKTECFGYTTKPGAPIYLLGETAYPFNRADYLTCSKDDTWSSFLLLPETLVPVNDNGIRDETVAQVPQFESPLDADFFVQYLGSNLLRGTQSIPTVDALRNTRLVGLYWSAQWCGPCRAFTSVLSEVYETLKDEFPAHGLEIVFVSSDRNVNEFRQYYASMPWLAIPFESLGFYKYLLDTTYHVRAIPSLVILDSLSGQVVVPSTETRQLVMQACNRGDDAIKSMFQNEWLARCPLESTQIIDLLAMSCSKASDDEEIACGDSNVLRSRLIRKESEEKKARIALLIEELVADGMERAEAEEMAVQVEIVSAAEDDGLSALELEVGPLAGALASAKLSEPLQLVLPPSKWASHIADNAGPDQLVSVLSTALKYLANCRKAPWTSSFRSFSLSFKVADRITRVFGSLRLLQSIGYAVHGTQGDFVVTIPIYADIDALRESLECLLQQYRMSDSKLGSC